MASHVVVIATDLRRTTIKVTPGTYLVDVLQEACKKLNLSSDKYLIKHKQKQVDLSVPFRTSGLLPGAKLELVQKANTPSAVQIALQVPHPEAKDIPGGRLIRKFPSDLTLWKVLRQFESGEAGAGRNLNLTARGVASGTSGSGQLFYETPVLNIMGRELATFADFQKTLSQLGHNSGNVLIRLSFRTTSQTLYEAMEQISQFFKETEEPAGANSTSRPGDYRPPEQAEDAVMADTAPAPTADDAPAPPPAPAAPSPAAAVASPSATEHQPQSGATSAGEAEKPTPTDRYQPVTVFLAPAGTTPAAALAPAEEGDFTPTVAHAQLHQARLQESSRAKRLPSDRELEERAAAQEARIAAIKSALVKVRFPDNTSSEWQVGPDDTGAFLYEAVRQVMAAGRQHAFRLVLPGGRTVLRDGDGPGDGLIRAHRFSRRVLVSLVWDDAVPADVRRQPFLRADVARRGQAVRVPEVPRAQDVADGPAPAVPPTASAGKGEAGKGEGGAKKMPKWFKLGKK